MNEKLIEMAKAAGFEVAHTLSGTDEYNAVDDLERFVDIIREDALHSQWQPIESAPKDGSFFDVWNSLLKTREANVWYCDGSFYVGSLRVATGATHWQPLPEPPKEKS